MYRPDNRTILTSGRKKQDVVDYNAFAAVVAEIHQLFDAVKVLVDRDILYTIYNYMWEVQRSDDRTLQIPHYHAD